MCGKVVLALLVTCACFLTSCSEKGDTSLINSNPSKPASTQNHQEQQASNQTKKDVLAQKYSVDSNGVVMNFMDTLDTLYKSDKTYTIYTDGFSFRYTVEDNNGNLLDMGYHDYRGSLDLYYQGNLLVLEYGFGGNANPSCRYYDVENGRVSSFYENPLATSDTKVAFFTFRERDKKNVLIVQDIFNVSDYYTEIERDFAGGTVLYYNCEAAFLDNGTKLQITYPFGVQEEGKTVEYRTEVLSLE